MLDVVSTGALLRALGGAAKINRLVSCLRIAPGNRASRQDVIDYIYGDDPTGGPDDADQAVYVMAHRLRRRGLAVECAKHDCRLAA